MPPKLQRRVTLSAGEECTVAGGGSVVVTLLTGAVDAAGVLLELNVPYAFSLRPGCRSLVLYTLEGGSLSLASDTPVTVHKAATGAATLVQLTRRTLLALERARVVVIGDHHSGKTLAAHTLVNLLRRHATSTEEGVLPCRVTLLDLNAESNALFSPGCFAAQELAVGSQPLWAGGAALPERLPVPFFVGTAARLSAADGNTFIHFCEQLNETVTAMLSQSRTDSQQKDYVVVDVPTPQVDTKEGVFYKKVVELLKPTHVVVVGNREQRQAADDWCTYLQEDVQRFLPECDFTFVDPCHRPCAQPPRGPLFLEYFTGTTQQPLGCSKVVVSAQSLQFVSLEEEGTVVVARRATPAKAWQGLVCALSHAETLEEVPLAPTAGLLIVSAVDEANDEVVFIIPAAQQEPLQRRFLVVPNAASQETMRVTETQNAIIEESVVV